MRPIEAPPELSPQPSNPETGQNIEPRHRRALVACARWESTSIAEWLSYHRHIGFDHVYLYCNDDDPAELYQAVLPFLSGEAPFVDFFHYRLQGFQTQMYLDFLRRHAQDCEWFMFLDIDEFVIVRDKQSIGDLIGELPSDVAALYLNWIFAGNCGHVTRPAGPVWSHYTRRAREPHPFTKALVRAAALNWAYLDILEVGGFWHAPTQILMPGARQVNVLMEDMAEYYDHFPKKAEAMVAREGFSDAVAETAFIYHVAFKSEQDLMRRFDRGTGGEFHTQVMWRDLFNKGRGRVRDFMQSMNAVEELGLIQVWTDILAPAGDRSIVQAAPGPNIAVGKTAQQSSVSADAAVQDAALDAAALIDGKPSGRHRNQTQAEHDPWWQVDLGADHQVREVRLFNRLDDRTQFTWFRILASQDGADWRPVVERTDDAPFGGIDGHFYAWRSSAPITARFIRIQGLGFGVLALDQVEIYDT